MKTLFKKRRSPRLVRPTSDVVLESGSVVHWGRIYKDDLDRYKIPVTCGRCLSTREVFDGHTRTSRFSGLCFKCNLENFRENSPAGEEHGAWRGGVFVNGGYRYIQLSNLSGKELEIAKQMARKVHNSSTIVAEHRLVMAISIGRPLLSSEVVHHRNGNKLDNSPDNLEITTHANHRKLDVKYYALWQQSLSRISELELELLKCKGERE